MVVAEGMVEVAEGGAGVVERAKGSEALVVVEEAEVRVVDVVVDVAVAEEAVTLSSPCLGT